MYQYQHGHINLYAPGWPGTYFYIYITPPPHTHTHTHTHTYIYIYIYQHQASMSAHGAYIAVQTFAM